MPQLPAPILHTTTYAAAILARHTDGVVHSVYDHTVNLQFGDHLLTLQEAGSPISPLTIQIGQPAAALPAVPGDPVRIDPDGSIHLPCAAEWIGQRTGKTSLHNCDLTADMKARHIASLPIERANTAAILHSVFAGEVPGYSGGASLSLTEELILPVIRQCLAECRSHFSRGEYTAAAVDCIRLLGLGGGLTPAGDDFLCGLLAAMILIGRRDHPFAASLRTLIRDRLADTHPVSAAFLRCATEDQFALAVHLLLTDVSGEDITKAFSAIGHTSGQDTLCGIRYGMTLL